MLTASTLLSSQTFQTQHEPFENIKHNVKTVQTNKRNFLDYLMFICTPNHKETCNLAV